MSQLAEARRVPKAGSKAAPVLGDDSHEKDSEASEECLRCNECAAVFVAVLGFGRSSEVRVARSGAQRQPCDGTTTGKRLPASFREDSTVAATGIGSRTASRHWPLFAVAFFAAVSFANAMNCTIDLSLISSSEFSPGFAQCDAGCDSCNFSLANDLFVYGFVECLPIVDCFVKVTTNENYGMYFTTVNGSLASALTVYTNDAGYDPWFNAVIHAPANRGDFRFEISNTVSALQRTTVHAVNSGVVDIVIDSDGVNDPFYPELYSVSIYASKAEELNIWLREDSRYSKYDDSTIECPSQGKCQWQSNAQRYDDRADYMRVVNVLIFPGTDLRLLCEGNAESCDGVVVYCNGTAENCDMQFASDWQCVGDLNSEGTCLANVNTMTTTATPTTTAPTSTTETRTSTTKTPTTTTRTPTSTTPMPTTTETATSTETPLSTGKLTSSTPMPTSKTPMPKTTATTTFTTEIPTTTKKPSTELPTTETPDKSTVAPMTWNTTGKRMSTTLKPSGDDSDNENWAVYMFAGGFCAVVCFCTVVAYYKYQFAKAQIRASDSAQTDASDCVAVDRSLIRAPPSVAADFSDSDSLRKQRLTHWFHATFEARFSRYLPILCKHGFDSIEMLTHLKETDIRDIPRGHCRHILEKAVLQQSADQLSIKALPSAAADFSDRRNSESLVREQPEGEQLADGSGAIAERHSVARGEGVEKDIDYKDEDELLYIQMGPNTVGHTEG